MRELKQNVHKTNNFIVYKVKSKQKNECSVLKYLFVAKLFLKVT